MRRDGFDPPHHPEETASRHFGDIGIAPARDHKPHALHGMMQQIKIT